MIGYSLSSPENRPIEKSFTNVEAFDWLLSVVAAAFLHHALPFYSVAPVHHSVYDAFYEIFLFGFVHCLNSLVQ